MQHGSGGATPTRVVRELLAGTLPYRTAHVTSLLFSPHTSNSPHQQSFTAPHWFLSSIKQPHPYPLTMPSLILALCCSVLAVALLPVALSTPHYSSFYLQTFPWSDPSPSSTPPRPSPPYPSPLPSPPPLPLLPLTSPSHTHHPLPLVLSQEQWHCHQFPVSD